MAKPTQPGRNVELFSLSVDPDTAKQFRAVTKAIFGTDKGKRGAMFTLLIREKYADLVEQGKLHEER